MSAATSMQSRLLALVALALLTGSIPLTAPAASRPALASRPTATSHEVETLSRSAARALSQNNTKALSKYVDTRWGVQISPEVYAQKNDVHLTRSQVARLHFDKTKRVWGTYYGEDGPILLDWPSYRKLFLWPRDYTRGAQFSVNRAPRGRSTVINNLRQFYPGATLAEFYLPSTSRDLMDWSSLWMVWRKRGTSWRLIGIAHDQWSP